MITRRKLKDKKGVSEIISYVLLIVISLGLATGIYTWLKVYVSPSQGEAEICQENTALTLNDYSCGLYGTNKIIYLDLQNTGYFSINGFFIKASNISGSGLATTQLKTVDYQNPINGRYDFSFINMKFSPGKKITANFSYNDLGSINKIHIQPFVISTKSKTIIPCENKVVLDIDSCSSITPVTPAPTVTDCSSPVTSGLVAFWRFEGDALDCTGRNNGSIVGNVEYTTAHRGTGLKLNGTNGNYVTIASNSDLEFGTNNFTISFWVNLINDTRSYNILDKAEIQGSKRWNIYIYGSETSINFFDTVGELSPEFTYNSWNHILYARNGSIGIYCLNKICSNNPTYFSGINFDNLRTLRIGCDSSNVRCMNGTLDEVMIFNRNLDQNEINSIYNS